jgi:hypothetical protein
MSQGHYGGKDKPPALMENNGIIVDVKPCQSGHVVGNVVPTMGRHISTHCFSTLCINNVRPWASHDNEGHEVKNGVATRRRQVNKVLLSEAEKVCNSLWNCVR